MSDHWSHLYQALSLESALCKILDVQKGNASFEHIFNPRWGSVVLLGSHLWLGLLLNMATELPPGGLQSQEVGSHNDIHTVSDHWSHLYQTLSLESALCKILDVERECIMWTYFQSTLGICSTLGKSPMNSSVFKHGYWAASSGLQSQGATTISILFPAKTLIIFLTTSVSFDSAFCNIFGVQKGNASLEHMFNPCWGSVVLLGSHIWKGVFLNMATELPPGDCKAKEPQLYPYCFRPKPWCIFLTTSLSFDSAFCNIFDVQKGNASFEHIFNPRWGSVVLLGSHLWLGLLLNMATELPPGDCKAKE